MAADGIERGIGEIYMQYKQTEWFWDNQLNHDAANLRNYYMTAYLHNEPRRTNVIISDYFNVFVKTWWKSRHVSLSKEDFFFFFLFRALKLLCVISVTGRAMSQNLGLLFSSFQSCLFLPLLISGSICCFVYFFWGGGVISHCVSCRLDWLKEAKGFIELIL